MIHLGFEVGTGTPVEIPLRNTVITGQTQRSGKTTALEALVARAGVRAIAFITKRGEGSFAQGRRVQPYFRERADWQFVDQLLAAQLNEKNKYLRQWIIKVCRTTRTLADVHRAVKKALTTAKGINEGAYTQLDAYLELIVPEIGRAKLATRLELGAGLNVMDVSAYPTPMQMLFVQSALDWVNEHERDVVTIIPEAWEFIPEGKGSPVKASATTLVRKGSGIHNHIWVDSQDTAGVDKVILRGCPVWLIGVQREANEIKRNLENIPPPTKRPKPGDVALLGVGQFFVCYEDKLYKTYVQPAWADAATARAVAMAPGAPGQVLRVEAVADLERGTSFTVRTIRKEEPVDRAEADRLTQENDELKRTVGELRDEIGRLRGDLPLKVPVATPAPPAAAHGVGTYGPVTDAMYESIKARLLKDLPSEPVLLKVLTQRPELTVEVTRQTIQADGTSIKGRIARLLAQGFYDAGATNHATRKELQRTGTDVNNANIERVLDELLSWGFLTRAESGGFQAVPGMKINIIDR